MTSDIPALRAALHALWADDDAAAQQAFETCFAPGCALYFSHPANVPTDAWAEVYRPLRAALPHAHRRDEIFITGANRRDVGGTWIAAFTHYVGAFAAPLWDIAPSNRLAFLRSGEFYRVQDDQIIEARIILDLPDLMRQAGRDPFGGLLGTEMLFPGPATHDGILPVGDG